MDYAEEMKITASTCLFLAIIVWMNNLQTPKIQAVLSSFFMTVMILHMVVKGVVGGGGGLEYKFID